MATDLLSEYGQATKSWRLLCEWRAQSKEDSSCPRAIVSSEHDLSGECAFARPTIVGGRTVYISKEVAGTNSYVAPKNPTLAQ